MKLIISIILSFTLATSAVAQNNQLSGGRTMIDGVTPEQIVLILQSLGLQSRLLGEQDGSFLVEGAVENEAMYVLLSECIGAGTTAVCTFIGPFGSFDTANVSLSFLNEFNMNASNGSVAGILPDDTGLMGVQLRTTGGVSAENFGNDLAYFFMDLENFLTAMNSVTGASVSLDTPAAATPAGFEALAVIFAADESFNPVRLSKPEASPLFMTDGVKGLMQGRLPVFPVYTTE